MIFSNSAHKTTDKFKMMFIILFLGFLGCQRRGNIEDHTKFDKIAGQGSTSSYTFKASDGLLHIKDMSKNSINLIASAPEFSFTITKLVDEPIDLTINIGNIPKNTEIMNYGTGSSVNDIKDLWLTKTWDITLANHVETFSTTISPQDNFSFLAFGDIQQGLESFDEMILRMNEEDASFIIGLGDLTSRAQEDEFKTLVDLYQNLDVPIYSSPGNHDVFQAEFFQKYFGSASYSFVFRNVRFTSLDSAWARLSDYTWSRFENWAKESADDIHIIYSHIPSSDISGIRAGQWSSRREAFRFQSLSSKYQVDLIMFGHVHSFDNYKNAGIQTIISGGSGGIPENFDGVERHFMRVDVDVKTNGLKVQMIEVP